MNNSLNNKTGTVNLNIAPLITAIDDDELAKRFDYLMLTIEWADLRGLMASKPKTKVVTTADRLSTKASIPQVLIHKDLIYRIQTDEFWKEADIFEYENVRESLRDLIKFLERENTQIYYTDFTDEILSKEEYEGEYFTNNLQSYRKKVNSYLKEHDDDLVVYKLRYNKTLTEDDIKHLEHLLWEEIGTKDDYINEFGEQPLLQLVSRLVGLDPESANEAFSEFLSDETLDSNQMEFVKMIVEHIINNGMIDKHVLREHPFNKYGNVSDLFSGRRDTAMNIIEKINELNGRINVG